MRFLVSFFLLAVVSSGVVRAANIYTEDFEDPVAGDTYTPSNVFNDGTNDHFNRTDGTDISTTDGNYAGFQGSFYWAGEDLDDGGGDGLDTKTITFPVVDTSALTNLTFEGLFAAGEFDGNAGFDDSEVLRVDASIDGGGFNPILQFAFDQDFDGDNDNFNEPLAQDTDFDGVGDGTVLNNNFQNFVANLPDANTVQLQLFVDADSASEEFAFDNFQINGDTGVIPTPAALPAGLALVAGVFARRRRKA